MKYILDTNIFNKLVDGSLLPDDLPSDGQFVATHIQIDELNNTANNERRAKLFLMFAKISPMMIPTESFILGVSRLDEAKLSDGDFFESFKGEFDLLNRGKANNIQDTLIAEVAAVNSFTLLTSDHDLAAMVKKHGILHKYFAV